MNKQDLQIQVNLIVGSANANDSDAIRQLLNLSMDTVKVTSAILNQYDAESQETTVIYESGLSTHTGVLEQTSDEGETYDERDFPTAYAWLTGDKHEPLTLQKDAMKRLSAEQREFIRYGIYTMLYLPVYVDGAFWGYIEFWESRFKRIFKDEEIELLNVITAGVAKILEEKTEA